MSVANIAQLLPYAPLEVGDETIQTINAEKVHDFLEVSTRYDLWITRQIKKYDFQEGRDYTTVQLGTLSNLTKGNFKHLQGIKNNEIEYHITFDMAKELTMVARQTKGKEARQYFIEEEKKLRHGGHGNLPKLRESVHYVESYARLYVEPVCWKCDELMSTYDLTLEGLRHYKVCYACFQSAYYAATQKQRDTCTWDGPLQSDRMKPSPFGKWKTARDVPALQEAVEQQRQRLQAHIQDRWHKEYTQICADPKLNRRHGIRLLRPVLSA